MSAADQGAAAKALAEQTRQRMAEIQRAQQAIEAAKAQQQR